MKKAAKGLTKDEFLEIFKPPKFKFDPSVVSASLTGSKLAGGKITSSEVKVDNVKLGIEFDEHRLRKDVYDMAASNEGRVTVKPDELISVQAKDVDLWRQNTDPSTQDWECPENSPYCKSHYQLRRCKMSDVHGPEGEIPRVTIHVSIHRKIRPEIKVFMEGKSSPIAFGSIMFESSEGARAFADALVEYGVVGYVAHSEDE